MGCDNCPIYLPVVVVVPPPEAEINTAYEGRGLVNNNTFLMMRPHDRQWCMVWMPDHSDKRMLQHSFL